MKTKQIKILQILEDQIGQLNNQFDDIQNNINSISNK